MSAEMKPSTQKLSLKVWGSRGSVPVSGPSTQRYGGDTSCYVIESDAQRLVIDAGSGIANYARSKTMDARPTALLLSHFHHDHLMGFPFWRATFPLAASLEVAAVPREGLSGVDALAALYRPPFFPASASSMLREGCVGRTLPVEGEARWGDLRVRWMDAPHPGGATAFRVDAGAASVLLMSDVELHDAGPALVAFAEGATAAFIDSQFLPEEIEAHRGWGHSSYAEALRFAEAANIEALYLTHHAPERSDAALDALVARARDASARVEVQAAYDGLELALSSE